jgi:hypothetical protein
MEVKIEKWVEIIRESEISKSIKLYNPAALDFKSDHRMKSIEFSDEYTRIEFIYRSSMLYINGGWIQMDPNAFIRSVGSSVKYRLIKTEGIPLAPSKHYFRSKGEYHTYTLIFPALPGNTKQIDIIEREENGTYFNFYTVDYSKWMKITHPMDIEKSNN